jgi:hypothetical protein
MYFTVLICGRNIALGSRRIYSGNQLTLYALHPLEVCRHVVCQFSRCIDGGFAVAARQAASEGRIAILAEVIIHTLVKAHHALPLEFPLAPVACISPRAFVAVVASKTNDLQARKPCDIPAPQLPHARTTIGLPACVLAELSLALRPGDVRAAIATVFCVILVRR